MCELLLAPLTVATSLDVSLNEATGSTEVTGPLPPVLELKQKTPKRNRCTVCRKKVGLTGKWVGGGVEDNWVGGRVAENWVGGRLAENWVGGGVEEKWVGGGVKERGCMSRAVFHLNSCKILPFKCWICGVSTVELEVKTCVQKCVLSSKNFLLQKPDLCIPAPTMKLLLYLKVLR